ncbi:unnamed protein product [Blepharisma stoltei]|uniref:Ubiquitin-like protease family profile domain-containing protein n=1 Tax=Blepharisma stoltei TaxID=1481888 RepID=A0AAU9K4M6_9CILI|nr:unnamed protein product [Blepharisma stoltei]
MRSVSAMKWYPKGNSSDNDASVRSLVDSDSDAMMSLPCHSSAYSRIFSKQNQKSNLLPTFLRKGANKSNLTQGNLSKFKLGCCAEILFSSPTPSVHDEPQYSELEHEIIQRLRELEPSNKINSIELGKIKDAFLWIFDPRFGEERKVFKIGHRKILSDKFLIFREGFNISEEILNCYMSIIVQMNRNLLNYNKVAAKVMVADSQFSEALILKGRSIIQPKVNILNYDLLMFPVYTNYWSLLVVNMNLNTITYFDPFTNVTDTEIFTKVINKFIHRAVRAQKLTTEHIPEYKYRASECFRGSGVDSGVIICNIAESLAIGKQLATSQSSIDTYRRQMMITLIKASLQ